MQTITIGKLAKACEVKVDTIRYYERKGILLPYDRTKAGYRVYSSDSVKRLRFIRKVQTLGFALNEIRVLLEISDSPDADCADIRDYARSKIKKIDTRISDLTKIKDSLAELAKFCPGKGKPLNECSILQQFYRDD